MARRLLIALCLLAAAIVALPAATQAKAVKPPTVTLVSPMRLVEGQVVTIRGKNFNKKARRNTVAFKGPNGRTVFAKPFRATSKRLLVKVPAGVRNLFSTRSGNLVSTRFGLQVYANGQRSSTQGRTSPVIVPPAGATPAPVKKQIGTGGSGTVVGPVTPAGPPPPCGTGNDWDGDLLSNALEAQLGTDPCKKDTDGDGVDDGFEYKSAVDLNNDEFQNPNTSLPYPGKKPYPNPLDGSDANVDFDGDSLTSLEEQKLWKYTIANGAANTLSPLTYSAGEKYSINVVGADGHRTPSLAAVGYQKQQDFLNWTSANGYRNVMLSTGPPWFPWYDQAHQQLFGILDVNRSGAESAGEARYYDYNGDGWLSDDERDEDGDGLTNFAESHGPLMNAGWWTSCYASEVPYPVQYGGTDMTNPDTNGDGTLDGVADQDHDDIPNIMEVSRIASSGLDDRKKQCQAKDLDTSNFKVTGGPLPNGGVTVTFQGNYAGQNVAQMTADGAGLTGGSSPAVAVTTSVNGAPGVNEQQRVTISGNPTGGNFTLTVLGQTTNAIAFSADAVAVQAALEEVLVFDPKLNHQNSYGRVNPFNPCLPDPQSRTCMSHPGFTQNPAPFDDSINWLSLN
jgi:hypothetical protein